MNYCITQDPENPVRFLPRRSKVRNDERLVREYAEDPAIKLGLRRVKQAGKLNCTCEAIAMHFEEFKDSRDIVIDKIERSLAEEP